MMKRIQKRMDQIEKNLKPDSQQMTQQEENDFISHQVKELRRYLLGVPFDKLNLLQSAKDEAVNQAVFAELTIEELKQIVSKE